MGLQQLHNQEGRREVGRLSPPSPCLPLSHSLMAHLYSGLTHTATTLFRFTHTQTPHGLTTTVIHFVITAHFTRDSPFLPHATPRLLSSDHWLGTQQLFFLSHLNTSTPQAVNDKSDCDLFLKPTYKGKLYYINPVLYSFFFIDNNNITVNTTELYESTVVLQMVCCGVCLNSIYITLYTTCVSFLTGHHQVPLNSYTNIHRGYSVA